MTLAQGTAPDWSVQPDLKPVDRDARAFISGTWVDAAPASRHAVICPFTEEVVAHANQITKTQADQALQAARDAFDKGAWPNLKPTQRAGILRKVAAGLEQRREELIRLMIIELGQPVSNCAGAIDYAIFLWRRYADIAEGYPIFEDRPVDAHRKARILREPVGVVLAITPWNSPLLLSSLKIAPALASGCTVVLKPASEGPLTFRLLGEALQSADFPPGVLNIVYADAEISSAMVHDPRIDMISFTGSTGTGSKIMGAAAENIARVALELGGKSASIVLDDADLAAVVPLLVTASGMALTGQQCTSRNRILVPQSKVGDWTDALVSALDALVVGDPRREGVKVGPLATQGQRARVEHYVALGKAEGASLLRGGKRPEQLQRGWYYEPTLFGAVEPTMTIAREEIFGPVLTILPYRDLEDAIGIANQTDYGLAGSVFGTDLDRAYEVARRVRAGTFQINMVGRGTDQPFGGYRRSGLGREGGVEGYEAFLEIKQVQLPIDVELTIAPRLSA